MSNFEPIRTPPPIGSPVTARCPFTVGQVVQWTDRYTAGNLTGVIASIHEFGECYDRTWLIRVVPDGEKFAHRLQWPDGRMGWTLCGVATEVNPCHRDTNKRADQRIRRLKIKQQDLEGKS